MYHFTKQSKLGNAQLHSVYQARDKILFRPIMLTQPARSGEGAQIENVEIEAQIENIETDIELENVEPQETINHLEDIISQQDAQNVYSNKQEAKISRVPKQKAKRNSFVTKGDVIPVLAPQEDETCFWLFWCAIKVKTTGIFNGKWQDRIGGNLEFRPLPEQTSTTESCVLWNPSRNKREVLSEDSFEFKDSKKEFSKYQLQLTIFSIHWPAFRLDTS